MTKCLHESFWNLQEHIFSTLSCLQKVCLVKPVKEKVRITQWLLYRSPFLQRQPSDFLWERVLKSYNLRFETSIMVLFHCSVCQRYFFPPFSFPCGNRFFLLFSFKIFSPLWIISFPKLWEHQQSAGILLGFLGSGLEPGIGQRPRRWNIKYSPVRVRKTVWLHMENPSALHISKPRVSKA